MKPHPALLVVLALGLALLAVRALTPSADPETEQDRSSQPDRGGGMDALAEPDLVEMDPGTAEPHREPSQEATPEPTPSSEREPLNGTVLVSGVDGGAVFPERGYILWEVLDAEGHVLRDGRTSIRGGAWSLDLDLDESARPVALVAGVRAKTYPCDFDMAQTYGHDEEDRTIEAYMRLGATIEVVDADTREHLSDVVICQATSACGDFSETFCVPPACIAEAEAIRGQSPLSMPERKGVIACWAGAPGYQWKAFAVEAQTRSATVELAKGASIQVVVEGIDPMYSDPAVILFPGGYNPNAPDGGVPNIPLAVRDVSEGQPTMIQGLPTGPCVLRIGYTKNARYIGPWMAQVDLDLEPGDNGTVKVDVRDEQSQRGLARVEILIPRDILGEKMPRNVCVVLERPGSALNQKYSGRALERYLGGEDAFEGGVGTVEAQGLPSGDYLATLLPLGVTKRAELRSDEINVIDFAGSPGMIQSSVRVTNEEGQSITTATVSVGHPESTAGVTMREVRDMLGSDGLATFWWPRGPLRIVVTAPSHEGVIFDTQAKRHGEQHEVRLSRMDDDRLSIVEFHRNGERLTLPLPFWTGIEVEGVDGASEGRLVRLQPLGQQIGGLQLHDGHGLKLHVSKRGTYRVRFPRLPGCPVVEDQAVELGGGETVALKVLSVL